MPVDFCHIPHSSALSAMNEPVRATPKVASAEDLFTAGILGVCLPTGPNSVGLDLALHLTPSPLKASLCAFMLRMLNATSIEYRADTSDGDDSAVIPITVKLWEKPLPVPEMQRYLSSLTSEVPRAWKNKARNARARTLKFVKACFTGDIVEQQALRKEASVSHHQDIPWTVIDTLVPRLLELAKSGLTAVQLAVHVLISCASDHEAAAQSVSAIADQLMDGVRDGKYAGQQAVAALGLSAQLREGCEVWSQQSHGDAVIAYQMLVASMLVAESTERNGRRKADCIEAAASVHCSPVYVAHCISVLAAVLVAKSKRGEWACEAGARMNQLAYRGTVPSMVAICADMVLKEVLPVTDWHLTLCGWFSMSERRRSTDAQARLHPGAVLVPLPAEQHAEHIVRMELLDRMQGPSRTLAVQATAAISLGNTPTPAAPPAEAAAAPPPPAAAAAAPPPPPAAAAAAAAPESRAGRRGLRCRAGDKRRRD